MKKYLIILSCLLVFFNLGKFLDITTNPPKEADIIVVLGGGKDTRIKKGLELYQLGYSKNKQIIFTGQDLCDTILPSFYRKQYLLSNGVKKSNILQIDEKHISNTMDEIFAVKNYILNKQMKSVLFVTHPTHTRRIKILANTIADYDDANITMSFAAADHTKVWDKNLFFLNLASIKLVLLETIKIPYNLIKYTLFL